MDRRDYRFRTFSGKMINILDPTPDDICLEDIAHGLALQTRFNGQCSDFYSVAQHSVLLSYQVEPGHMMDALMHDAPEAYIGDCVTMLKKQLPLFKALEDVYWKAISEKFGCSPELPEEVERKDKIIYGDERQRLFRVETNPKLGIEIQPWGWKTAKQRFLNRYEELVYENQ